jgi:dTDP-4-dehydrorhamnose reductase
VGAHGGNFAKTMLRLAAERERLAVVADQIGAPTSAALLAEVTAHLVRQHGRASQGFQPQGFPCGVYHVTAGGETSWYDYARFVLAEAQGLGRPLKAGPDAVAPLTSAEYPTPARRPANSRLDTQAFRAAFGLRLPPWQDGVRHVLRQLI